MLLWINYLLVYNKDVVYNYKNEQYKRKIIRIKIKIRCKKYKYKKEI